ncbi:MAG: hypothetical protein NTY38_03320 [Acidobacteria bacterium]|nr:hypothetical protein [Acidobacteriota bacterium]
MNRRRFLLAAAVLSTGLAVAATPGPVSAELAARVGDLAGALADGNAGEFMRQFDRRMPGYEELRRNVQALVDLAAATSSVKPFSQEVEGARHIVQAEWSLEVKLKGPHGGIEQRNQTVKLVFEKQGRNWRIVNITPRGLFDPPAVTGR